MGNSVCLLWKKLLINWILPRTSYFSEFDKPSTVRISAQFVATLFPTYHRAIGGNLQFRGFPIFFKIFKNVIFKLNIEFWIKFGSQLVECQASKNDNEIVDDKCSCNLKLSCSARITKNRARVSRLDTRDRGQIFFADFWLSSQLACHSLPRQERFARPQLLAFAAPITEAATAVEYCDF